MIVTQLIIDCLTAMSAFAAALQFGVYRIINRNVSQQLKRSIFRQISKIGTIRQDSICSRHVNQIVNQVALDAKIVNTDQMSAHSLRRGFATEAVRFGASMPATQKHGRWKSTKTVFEYIEAGRQFQDNAVHVMFGAE